MGVTLALSVHEARIAVRSTSVPVLSPLGVGINLQPAAVRELTEPGLGGELEGTGIATQALSYFNKFGQLIWNEPRGLSAGYKWPQYSIHRGQLQVLLLRAARERIGDENYSGGLQLISFEQNPSLVTATFRDSKTGTTVVENADILVGADGIHSAVRRQLYRSEGQPRFARQLLWRAAVNVEPFLDGHRWPLQDTSISGSLSIRLRPVTAKAAY